MHELRRYCGKARLGVFERGFVRHDSQNGIDETKSEHVTI
jgi:hypothetical protein